MATFSERFNKNLGRQIGVKAKETPKEAISVDRQARHENRLRAIALSELLTEKAAQRSPTGSNETFEPILGQFNKPAVDLILDAEESGFDGSDGGFSIGGALKGVGKGLANVGTGALDVVSRSGYGLFEAMKEHSESRNEGQNDLEAIDDILGGLWSGLSGNEKTGFGEVVEENAKRAAGSTPINIPWLNVGEGLNDLAESRPGLAQNIKRGAGFVGEVGLDPFNFTGIGLIAKLGKGAKYTDDAFKAATKTKAHKIIDSKGLAKTFDAKKLVTLTDELGVDGGKITRNLPVGRKYVDDIIDEAIDKATLEIKRSGRVLGGDVAPYTVSSQVAEGVRQFHFSAFDKKFEQFLKHIDGSEPLTSSQLKTLKKDELFKDFTEEYLKTLNRGRPKNPFSSIDEAIEDLLTKDKPIGSIARAQKAAADVKAKFNKTLTEIQDELHGQMLDEVYNTPGFRVGQKVYDIPGVSKIGKAYTRARRTKLDTPGTKGLSFSRQFPGRTALMNQRIRSTGIRRYEDFAQGTNGIQANGRPAVVTVAKTLTKPQRKELTKFLVDEVEPTDPKMKAAYNFIREEYDRIFKEEMDAGVRAVGKTKASNYVYNYLTGKPKNIKRLRDRSREIVRSTGKISPGYLDEAKAAGLKVEDDAFRALLLRELKSNKDMTRSWFTEDLLDHYGIKAHSLDRISAGNRRLTKIVNNVPEHLKRELKPGESYYLPDDIRDIYDNYLKLLGSGYSEDTAALIRKYDYITRLFKTSATIPFPGFHIRNAMGDVFMSHFDGVKSSDYGKLLKLQNDARRGKTAQVLIGDRNFSYEELKDLFRKNASSGGFYSTDLGISEFGAATKVNAAKDFAGNTARTVGNAARTASEHREDFFRFAHFLKAFRDEYPNALKNTKNADNALLNAVEASTYRVNKHLFDYGALTATEKNVLRRIIPFYTYSRKVMPTLMESLLLNPAQLAKTNRALFDNSQPEIPEFNNLLVPNWQREIGYARLTDEPEPWILGAQFLPTDVLRENTNFSDLSGLSRNLISQMNPQLKAVPELAFGKKAFNEQPVESGPGYFTDALVPPINPIMDLIGKGNKQGIERLLSGRIGLGLPISQITEDKQISALYGLENELEESLSKTNDAIEKKGLRLYISKRKDGATYRIRDLNTDEVVFETTNPREAVKRGNELAKVRK